MVELKLVSLVCHSTDDTGEDDTLYDVGVEDEPYIKANHKRVWSGRMKAGGEEDLTGVDGIPFGEKVRIELWDRDAGPESGQDDKLGELVILSAQAGLGELTHQFKTRTANYSLKYRIE